MEVWPMQGELGSKHWGNRLPGSGGTAGPGHQNGFLIKESENPFRQAWLGKKLNSYLASWLLGSVVSQ